MQRLLADPDRRVRPDLVVRRVGGHLRPASTARNRSADARAPRRSRWPAARARSLTSTRGRPPRRGTRDGDRQPDHAVPAAEVEDRGPAPAARSRGTAPRCRCRAGPAAKTPDPLSARARAPTPRRVNRLPRERHRRVGGEVVLSPSIASRIGRAARSACARRARRRPGSRPPPASARAACTTVTAGSRCRPASTSAAHAAGRRPSPTASRQPTSDAHHVVAERVGPDRRRPQAVASRLQREVEQRADRRRALAPLAERGEVVLAEQRVGGLVHRVEVERPRPGQHVRRGPAGRPARRRSAIR